MLRDHLDEESLSDYLRGELTEQAEQAAEAHIASCIVCARRLQAEAQLETLLHSAAKELAPPSKHRRSAMWQRVASGTLGAVGMAAAVTMVLSAPGDLLTPQSAPSEAGIAVATPGDTSVFINDAALCRPSNLEEAEICVEPLAVAITTEPEDYLSPYDREKAESFGVRGSWLNTCEVEDDELTCEPVAG